MSDTKKSRIEINPIADDAARTPAAPEVIKGGVGQRSSPQGSSFFDEADALFGKVAAEKKTP